MITQTTSKVSKQPKFQGPDELPMLPQFLIEMNRTETDKYHILMREWWESVHENLERLRQEVVSFQVSELEENTSNNLSDAEKRLTDSIDGVASDLSDHENDKSNPHEVTPQQLNLHAVATSGAYSDLTGKPNLHAVATSGDYTDLSNTPSFSYDTSTRTLSIST